MATKAQVISKFRRAIPQVDEMRAANLFDDAHREILARCRLREVTITVSLTAGTRLYDLTELAVKVLGADHKQSATSYTALGETSVDEMDMNKAGWRTSTIQGTPARYFLTGKASTNTSKLQIGFDPIPNTTTSGGYPSVDVHVQREVVLALSETIPPQLYSDAVYVSVMGEKACREIPELREQWGYWKGLAADDLDANMEWVKNRTDRLPTRLRLGTRNNRVV